MQAARAIKRIARGSFHAAHASAPSKASLEAPQHCPELPPAARLALPRPANPPRLLPLPLSASHLDIHRQQLAKVIAALPGD